MVDLDEWLSQEIEIWSHKGLCKIEDCYLEAYAEFIKIRKEFE